VEELGRKKKESSPNQKGRSQIISADDKSLYKQNPKVSTKNC
jgi:hypothetical protein